MKIGGNLHGIIQIKTITGKNEIGENITDWLDVCSMKGFLDLMGSDVNREKYFAKVKECSHVFICDFKNLHNLTDDWLWDPLRFDHTLIKKNASPGEVEVTSELCRLIVKNKIFRIKYIDDPMELHKHLEIYLDEVTA